MSIVSGVCFPAAVRSPHTSCRCSSCRRLPIHIAAAAGHGSRVHALLHALDGLDTVLAQDAAGRTPLMAAAAKGHAEVAALLLDAAPQSVSMCDSQGRSALHHAAAARHLAAVQVLLHIPGACAVAESGCSSEWASNPLHLAVSRGCCEADVLTILQADPSAAMDVSSDERQTPLQVRLALHELPPVRLACCAQRQPAPTAVCLARHRWNLLKCVACTLLPQEVQQLIVGRTPLSHPAAPHPSVPQLAIQAGRLDLVQLLIPASNLTDVPWSGCTPLHTAVRCQWEAAIQLLLQAAPEAAAARSRDQQRRTPLCEAAAAGCTSIVQLILDAAPEAATASSGPGESRWLPIHAAAEEGHAAVVQLLLAAAPDTAAAASGIASRWGAPPGSTPLHLAAASGDVGTVQLLLASTAPAAALALDGNACLPAHRALKDYNMDALRLLLQAAPAAASSWDGDGQVRVQLAALCWKCCVCHRTDVQLGRWWCCCITAECRPLPLARCQPPPTCCASASCSYSSTLLWIWAVRKPSLPSLLLPLTPWQRRMRTDACRSTLPLKRASWESYAPF